MKIRELFGKLGWDFILIVVLPTALSIIYFGFIASDRYVAVSNFVVRSPQKTASVSGLSAFLQNVGFSRSTDDSYIVSDYILSRDAVSELQGALGVKDKYSSKNIDLFSRFGSFEFSKGNENFYDYYKGKVSVSLDSASSISTLRVKAYTAQDAYEINEKLLEQAENLVNRLNERGRHDMVVTAEQNVQKAEQRVLEASGRLAKFREERRIFDVDKQAAIQLQLLSKLQDQLILVNAQLAQLRAVTPENPQIGILNQRAASIRKEIEKETQKSLGGESSSLNQKAIEYEKLTLEKEFANKQLASALATLEQNKAEADRKQLYLERISKPQRPDEAVEPLRLRAIITVFLAGLILLGIFRMLLAGVTEHQE